MTTGGRRDFAAVAAAALANFDTVVDWLGLGAGKNQGREYLPLNPKRSDTKPGSFTINLFSSVDRSKSGPSPARVRATAN